MTLKRIRRLEQLAMAAAYKITVFLCLAVACRLAEGIEGESTAETNREGKQFLYSPPNRSYGGSSLAYPQPYVYPFPFPAMRSPINPQLLQRGVQGTSPLTASTRALFELVSKDDLPDIKPALFTKCGNGPDTAVSAAPSGTIALQDVEAGANSNPTTCTFGIVAIPPNNKIEVQCVNYDTTKVKITIKPSNLAGNSLPSPISAESTGSYVIIQTELQTGQTVYDVTCIWNSVSP